MNVTHLPAHAGLTRGKRVRNNIFKCVFLNLCGWILMYDTNPLAVGSMSTKLYSSLTSPYSVQPQKDSFFTSFFTPLGCYSSGLQLTACDFAFNFLHHLTTCFYVTNLSKIYLYLLQMHPLCLCFRIFALAPGFLSYCLS